MKQKREDYESKLMLPVVVCRMMDMMIFTMTTYFMGMKYLLKDIY